MHPVSPADPHSRSARPLARAVVAGKRRAFRLHRRVLGRAGGEFVLRERYRSVTGQMLDLDQSQGFTEKLYWRMISNHRQPDPEFTRLSDKYRVREFVRARIGQDALVPLLWHGTDPAAIPFDALPPRAVIKSNHACGQVIIWEGGADRAGIRTTVRSWLSANYYWTARESQYYDIEPRILIEEYLQDGYSDGPLDYRFFCFAGEPALVQVSDHSHALHRFYDLECNRLPISFRDAPIDYNVRRPPNLGEMTSAARALSRGFDFVRVDLYPTAAGVAFGEMTFTPSGGYRPFRSAETERLLGDLWRLPGPLPPRRLLRRKPDRAE